MSETYIIAASRGELTPFSTVSHLEQVRPILQSLLEKSRVPARRVQEVHWHGGDEEFWFNSLGRSLGFAPELAGFHWPATALLAHAELQNMARAIEDGDRDLVIVAQETGQQVITLLLASPSAVGIYNLSPRACLGLKVALSGSPESLLKAAFAVLKKADEEQQDQEAPGSSIDENSPFAEVSSSAQAPLILQPNYGQQTASNQPGSKGTGAGEVQWVASARQPDSEAFKAAFPTASWLGSDQGTPPGDLFLLSALVERLEAEKTKRGLLISEGPQKSGLVTLVERI